jgi:hypothetical protein
MTQTGAKSLSQSPEATWTHYQMWRDQQQHGAFGGGFQFTADETTLFKSLDSDPNAVALLRDTAEAHADLLFQSHEETQYVHFDGTHSTLEWGEVTELAEKIEQSEALHGFFGAIGYAITELFTSDPAKTIAGAKIGNIIGDVIGGTLHGHYGGKAAAAEWVPGVGEEGLKPLELKPTLPDPAGPDFTKSKSEGHGAPVPHEPPSVQHYVNDPAATGTGGSRGTSGNAGQGGMDGHDGGGGMDGNKGETGGGGGASGHEEQGETREQTAPTPGPVSIHEVTGFEASSASLSDHDSTSSSGESEQTMAIHEADSGMVCGESVFATVNYDDLMIGNIDTLASLFPGGVPPHSDGHVAAHASEDPHDPLSNAKSGG